MATEPVRWGILGTAGIAESAFLPALHETGDGVAQSGFSQSTVLPASSAAIVHSACIPFGRGM